MISAFARGGAILEEPRYAAAARRAAEFLIARVYDAANRRSAGAAGARAKRPSPAFLDDYALFTQGLLDLYEAQFGPAGSGTRHPPYRKTDGAV